MLRNMLSGQPLTSATARSVSSHAGRVDRFYLPEPRIPNTYSHDPYLQAVVHRLGAPLAHDEKLQAELRRLGERCSSAGDLTRLGFQAEAQPPTLTHYGPFGQRVDDIGVSAAWDRLKDASAQEGIVAEGYNRAQWGQFARLAQFAKMYVFYPATAVFSCPLAMTDGAARVLELYGGADGKQLIDHLLSRDPATFWTSGQHMTERTGGSDLSNSETIAREQEDGSYRLYGYKFFTSATTSEMAIGLARTVDREGKSVAGTRGLSCFVVRMHRTSDGALDGIVVHRLKDKLGTKAVPTAELEFVGCPATLLGPLNRGVPVISSLFNVTRWQTAVWAASAMRRALHYAQAHAKLRNIGDVPLAAKPLHLETLADLELETRAATQLAAHTSLLLGRDEALRTSEDDATVLRMLTPLVKLYLSKQAMYVLSECIECVGGVGYTEQTGLPQLLRDAQVMSVWEGTTNVLSLDVWRAIAKSNGLVVLLADMEKRLASSAHPDTASTAHAVRAAMQTVASFAKRVSQDVGVLESTARQFSYSLARTYIATLLLEHASFTKQAVDVECARRWVAKQPLVLVSTAMADQVAVDHHRKCTEALALGSKL